MLVRTIYPKDMFNDPPNYYQNLQIFARIRLGQATHFLLIHSPTVFKIVPWERIVAPVVVLLLEYSIHQLKEKDLSPHPNLKMTALTTTFPLRVIVHLILVLRNPNLRHIITIYVIRKLQTTLHHHLLSFMLILLHQQQAELTTSTEVFTPSLQVKYAPLN